MSVTQGAHSQRLLGTSRAHPGSGMWKAGETGTVMRPQEEGGEGNYSWELEHPRVSGLPGRCALLPQEAALGTARAPGPGPPHTGRRHLWWMRAQRELLEALHAGTM